MTDDADARYLEKFSSWLSRLGEDTKTMAALLDDESQPDAVRRPVAMGLNYLFKSLDLIDDGIEGLGFLDDAFVLRLAASRTSGHVSESVQTLAADIELIREFLGDLMPRFEKFFDGLERLSVRQRSVEAILNDTEPREELLSDVRAFANRYQVPTFARDDKSLVKLRSFLDAKLPA